MSTSIPKLPKRIDEFLVWKQGRDEEMVNAYDKKAVKKKRKGECECEE